MNKRLIITLIVLNLIWSVSASIYDSSVIVQTPLLLWPFLIICPIFPLLLALVWGQIYKDKRPNNYLLAFAAIPSIFYLAASLLYYPTWMLLNYFDWYAFGQIFWVAFYGIQAIYLLFKFTLAKTALWLVGAFLIISLTVQYRTKTLGFQDFTNFSDNLLSAGYLTLTAVVLALLIFLTIYSSKIKRSENKSARR